MNYGKFNRSYCIRFQTEHPINFEDRKLYQTEFGEFRSTGLWLEYDTRAGTAYFANEESANEAFKSLCSKNSANMKLDAPTRSGDDYRYERQYKPKWKDHEDNDIVTSVDVMFDIFGNEIPALTSNEGKIYIPLEYIENSGYKMFHKQPSMQESNEHWNTKLKTYLLHQAMLYIFMNKVHFDSKSILPMINSLLSSTVNSPEVVTSNNNLENDTLCQESKRTRIRTETLPLDVNCKVTFLNNHVDGIYYVRAVQNEDIYNLIQVNTLLHASNSQRIQPKLNRINAAKYNGIWQRAVLQKVGPVPEFFFVDLGKSVTGRLEIRSIPEDLYRIPGQAIRVRLTQGCTAKEDQVLDIVATRQYEDGTYLIKPAGHRSGFTSDNDGSFKEEKWTNSTPTMKSPAFKTSDNFDSKYNANDQKPALRMPKTGSPNKVNSNNSNCKTPPRNSLADKQVIRQNNGFSITAKNNSPGNGSLKRSPESALSPASSTSSLNRVTVPSRRQMSKIHADILNKIEVKNVPVKPSRECISDYLKGTQGCVEYADMGDANSFIAFILPCTKLEDIDFLESIKDNVKFNANYSPTVGDTVAVDYLQDGETETSSVRAVVLDNHNNKYKVALVDYGKIIIVDKVAELPPQYMETLEYAASCSLEKDIMDKIKEQERLNYYSEKNGEMIIDLDGEPQKILCKKWNPLPNTTEKSNKQELVLTIPPANPTQPGEAVKLMNQENGLLAIRTHMNYTLLKTIVSELQKHEAEKLQSPPVLNQIVLYKVGNDLQRGQVKLITGNSIKVFKIDYGCTEITEIENLYYIDKFSNYPHTMLLLKLDGYEEGYESIMVQHYLKDLFGKQKLNVKSITEDSIDLLLPNNISLTQKLTLLAKPPFKRMEDIPPAPELPVGESTDVILLHPQDLDHCELIVMVCDHKIQEDFVQLSNKLPACEDTPSSLVFYLGQVCVGKYDDGWYRACITEVDNAKEQYLVYFFDFGNYERIGIDDLRELPEDLANFGAMAIKCHLKDLHNKYNGNIPEKYKNQLLSSVGSVLQIKVISKHGDTYYIDIPALN